MHDIDMYFFRVPVSIGFFALYCKFVFAYLSVSQLHVFFTLALLYPISCHRCIFVLALFLDPSRIVRFRLLKFFCVLFSMLATLVNTVECDLHFCILFVNRKSSRNGEIFINH